MTSLLENPMPILLVGILIEVALGYLLVTMRKRAFAIAMGAVLLVMVAGLVAERFVVTERERIQQALYAAAAAIETNDITEVEKCLAKNAEGKNVRDRAAFYMGLVEIQRIKLSDVKVGEINRLASPPTVEVSCYGLAEYKDKTGLSPYNHYAHGFAVEMVRDKGEWKIQRISGDPQNPGTR
jgi:hypothetical protein